MLRNTIAILFVTFIFAGATLANSSRPSVISRSQPGGSWLSTITLNGHPFALYRAGRTLSVVREDGDVFRLTLSEYSNYTMSIEGFHAGRHFRAVQPLGTNVVDSNLNQLAIEFHNFTAGPSHDESMSTVHATGRIDCALSTVGWGLAFAGLVLLTPESGGASIAIAVGSFEVASASLAYSCAV